jgi:outer membrane lipoprotein-sorting protein
LLAVLVVGSVAAAYLSFRAPSVATILARANAARAKITSVQFTLSTPWPQAQPAVTGLPGARALLGPSEGERTWRVLWRSDGSLRAELVSPAENAGTLTIVTAETTWVWSPLLQVALSAATERAAPLWVDQLLALAGTGVSSATLAEGTRARDATYRVNIPVRDATAGDETLSLWFDRKSALPVRAELVDANGRLLGALAVSDVDLAPGAGEDDFRFVPPDGARVVDLGVLSALPDLAAATAATGIPALQPSYLPAGFVLKAVNAFGRTGQASLVLTYHRAAAGEGEAGGILSVTVFRAGSSYAPLPYGLPVRVGEAAGKSFELGELRGLDWRQGEYGLSLFGTISAAELLRVAATIR